ncbi:hypothetical protein GGX14DRAFT_609862 [Mycena pura]|uniref:Uncharacterized protein n=1 Tax=Mycena pura TaxID=153505 RepID=A0AAD6VKP4_9AGAR|nr:hypothetical protein GGX14DRAFT_609862 [Mycena pura]
MSVSFLLSSFNTSFMSATFWCPFLPMESLRTDSMVYRAMGCMRAGCGFERHKRWKKKRRNQKRGLDRAVPKRRSLAAIKKFMRWQNKSRVSRFSETALQIDTLNFKKREAMLTPVSGRENRIDHLWPFGAGCGAQTARTPQGDQPGPYTKYTLSNTSPLKFVGKFFRKGTKSRQRGHICRSFAYLILVQSPPSATSSVTSGKSARTGPVHAVPAANVRHSVKLFYNSSFCAPVSHILHMESLYHNDQYRYRPQANQCELGPVPLASRNRCIQGRC